MKLYSVNDMIWLTKPGSLIIEYSFDDRLLLYLGFSTRGRILIAHLLETSGVIIERSSESVSYFYDAEIICE